MSNQIPDITLGSKEYYDAMEFFETVVQGYKKEFGRSVRAKTGKCGGMHYHNGAADAEFKSFLQGASYMRSLALNSMTGGRDETAELIEEFQSKRTLEHEAKVNHSIALSELKMAAKKLMANSEIRPALKAELESILKV